MLRDQGGQDAVKRYRYFLVLLPGALIHKIMVSAGDRGLLQPSSESGSVCAARCSFAIQSRAFWSQIPHFSCNPQFTPGDQFL